MGGKKKYIEMFGSFSEPFTCVTNFNQNSWPEIAGMWEYTSGTCLLAEGKKLPEYIVKLYSCEDLWKITANGAN